MTEADWRLFTTLVRLDCRPVELLDARETGEKSARNALGQKRVALTAD